MTAVDVRCPAGCGEHVTVDLATSEVARPDMSEAEATDLILARALTVGARLIDALVTHKLYDCAELSPLLGDPAGRAAPASAPDEGEPAGCPGRSRRFPLDHQSPHVDRPPPVTAGGGRNPLRKDRK